MAFFGVLVSCLRALRALRGVDPDGGGCYGRPAKLGGLALGVIPGGTRWELWINGHWLALFTAAGDDAGR